MTAVQRVRLSWFLSCAVLGLLAGCAVQPPVSTRVLDVTEQRALLAGLEHFDFQGRVGSTRGNQGTQASISWEQRGPESLLRLAGPLGAGATRLRLTATDITITNARGEKLEGEAALAALGNQVGMQPPLAALRFWVLGLPAPDSPAQESLDDGGRLATLAQQGWSVTFDEYRVVALPQGQVQLPRRLTASRDDLRLRLVIDKWDIGP